MQDKEPDLVIFYNKCANSNPNKLRICNCENISVV